MITSYDKFKYDRLNEGLWDSLKNLFSKLLQGVSDEIKKPVDELNNKLSKTKDPKQMEVIMANYLKVHNTTLTNQLKAAKNLPELKKVVKDNLTGIYAGVTAASKTLGKDTFTFSEIFADSPANMKKLFDANEKVFNKNVDAFTNDLIVTQAAQFPSYKDKKATQSKLTETSEQAVAKKDAAEKEAAKGNTPTETKPEQNNTTKPEATKPEQNNATNQEATKTTESINVLNEEADQAPAEVKEDPADFQKLKDSMKKWFDFSIYKKVNETLKAEKNPKPAGTLEDKIKNMTATKNAESVTKMVDALTKADMAKLKQVRDILGLDKTSAPL